MILFVLHSITTRLLWFCTFLKALDRLNYSCLFCWPCKMVSGRAIEGLNVKNTAMFGTSARSAWLDVNWFNLRFWRAEIQFVELWPTIFACRAFIALMTSFLKEYVPKLKTVLAELELNVVSAIWIADDPMSMLFTIAVSEAFKLFHTVSEGTFVSSTNTMSSTFVTKQLYDYKTNSSYTTDTKLTN